ncbi:hypothetical protein SAMN06266982_10686 [Propioniciclava tarda]|nr:hypothetical protein SAMN06266982_10686 [Propioniciclava tarda]
MAVAAKAASSTTSKRRRNRHVEGTKPSTRIRCDSTEHSRRTRRRVLSGYPGSITGNAYGGTVQAPSETLASEATSFRTDEREPRADLYWLIDADNFFYRDDQDGAWARHTLIRLLRDCTSLFGDVSRVAIRLYGGWQQGGLATTGASKIRQTMALAFPFPLVLDGKIIHGTWDLAQSLLSHPHIQFGDTLRERQAPPRLRLAKAPCPDGCAGAVDTCPPRLLQKMTRAGSKVCPTIGCEVRTAEMFTTREQKQVDTLLTADLLQLASLAHPAIVCLSDDTDFVPGLIASSIQSAPVAFANLEHPYDQATRDLLANLGVRQLNIAIDSEEMA